MSCICEMGMKTGIVDVGGGLRGIYAAGVLDYCMDQGISFDLGIGVSARKNYGFPTERRIIIPHESSADETLQQRYTDHCR